MHGLGCESDDHYLIDRAVKVVKSVGTTVCGIVLYETHNMAACRKLHVIL